MSSNFANVVVHLAGGVSPGQRADLERVIAAEPGVGRAAISHKTERLMLVDYDPFATTARRILQAVRDSGVTARLIGL